VLSKPAVTPAPLYVAEHEDVQPPAISPMLVVETFDVMLIACPAAS